MGTIDSSLNSTRNIPKVIHYCWFGCKPIPESALKCIDSWRRFFPDYEIREWNDSNFDVGAIPYTKEAYDAKKFAFVSDYARFKILYDQGGLYFDTDVEVIRPMDDIISSGSFMGFEIDTTSETYGKVNPGVGMGAIPGLEVYRQILDYYNNLHFILPDGTHNVTDAVVNITTRELIKVGLKKNEGIQAIGEIKIYPAEYFNPLDDATGKLTITSNTYSIHWFTKTWLNASPLHTKVSRFTHRLFGTKFTSIIRKKLKIFS